MSSEIAKKLIELGGDEWEKGAHHRVYVYGYVVKKFFDNEHAAFGKAHKTFFDVTLGKFKSENSRVEENLNILLEELA